MSDLFYPSGRIEDIDLELIDRTLIDEFGDGSTNASQRWPERYFKRRFKVLHSPLTQDEYKPLRAFFSARSGRYDPFWFRDNVHRTGNAKVRLAEPFRLSRARHVYTDVNFVFEEIAPQLALIESGQIFSILGTNPDAFWDPGRAIYYEDPAGDFQELTIADEYAGAHPLAWNNADPGPFQGTASYANAFNIATKYAVGSTAGPVLSSQSAYSIFGIFLVSGTGSGQKILTHVGSPLTQKALGLQINGDQLAPWVGATESWTAATVPTYAYFSACVTWAASSNTATLYVNGVSSAPGSNTRAYQQSAFALGAASDGSKSTYGANTCYTGPVISAAIAFNSTQVAQLHNLFATHYGMTTI